MKCEPIESCPLCGYSILGTRPTRGSGQPVGDIVYPMTYHFCPKCGLYFQNPMWYFDYASEYNELRNQVEGNSSLSGAVTETMRGIKLVDVISSVYGKPKSILEIGSGIGATLALAKLRFGCRVMGVEPWDEGRASAKKSDGIECVPTIKDLPDEDWEVIICSHVLEHVYDPHAFLAEFPARKEGLQQALVLEVPNGFSRHCMNLWHPTLWTTSTLKRLFQERGWEGPTATHTHGWPSNVDADAYLSMVFWR